MRCEHVHDDDGGPKNSWVLLVSLECDPCIHMRYADCENLTKEERPADSVDGDVVEVELVVDIEDVDENACRGFHSKTFMICVMTRW
jgi:hypothetical protein